MFSGEVEDEIPSGAIAVALWVFMTHSFEPFPPRGEPTDDLFDHAARLMISAGTIRSGKTRLLETTACLGRRVLRASNLSAAVMFRIGEQVRPLIMLDEVDQSRLHDDGNALTQLLNDGFEPNGMAWRVGGEQYERVDNFRVFMPVALAGVGRLPSATEDRCIRIVLLRKPATRRTARFNKAKKAELRLLTPQIRRWMQDNRKAIVPNLEPVFPPEVDNDRDEDLWRPLLAIADTMGGDVAALARRAMVELSAVAHEPGEGEELMAALFDILSLELANRDDEKGDIKIALSRLVGLVNHHDGPWTEYRNGLGCDQRWLSTTLRRFKLLARNVRDPHYQDGESAKGDAVRAIQAVAARYRTKDEEAETESRHNPPTERPTSPTCPIGDDNPLKNPGKNGSENVGDECCGTSRKSHKPAERQKTQGDPQSDHRQAENERGTSGTSHKHVISHKWRFGRSRKTN